MRLNSGVACATCSCLVLVSGALCAAERGNARVIEQVVVTATQTEHDVRAAPASISVITREELEDRPVQDLADALQGASGVHVGGVGLARRGVSIRGMSTDYTLTLLNGRRINQTGGIIGHSELDLGWVPAEAIERIEIVRGPMSSLYGSDALGGVVNVITRSATDAWRGSVTSRAGWREDGRGGETRQIGLYAGGPLVQDVLGLSAYGEFRERRPTPGVADPDVSEMEGREASSGTLALNWQPTAAQRIELTYGRGDEERARDTRFAGGDRYYYHSVDQADREHWAVSHTAEWGWGSSAVRAYGSTLEKTNTRSQGTPTRPQTLEDRIVDGRTTIPLGERHLLSVGGEWRKEELSDAATNSAGFAEAIHRAVFVQDEIELGRWLLLVGDRYDRHERFGGQHSPRAYIVYRANDAIVVKGGAGRGFKAPNFKLLSPEYTVSTATFTVFGNPDLEPEISTTYELGADYRAGEGWSLDATIFRNEVDDLIQSYCVADCDAHRILHYENVEEARIQGGELGTTVALPWSLGLRANYTYLDARNLSTDGRLAERPRHSVNVTFTWTPTAAFSAQVRGKYLGDQVIYSRDVLYDLPSYSLWSLDLNHQLTERWRLHVSAENLGDKSLADLSSQFRYVEPGRSYSLGLTGSF